jgi:hypothetical protein
MQMPPPPMGGMGSQPEGQMPNVGMVPPAPPSLPSANQRKKRKHSRHKHRRAGSR